MRAQVDPLDDAISTAPANKLELHVDECSISMDGPAVMVLATRIARKRSALTHMCAHSRVSTGKLHYHSSLRLSSTPNSRWRVGMNMFGVTS
eukprot:1234897-Prymnesium_polylepis.2